MTGPTSPTAPFGAPLSDSRVAALAIFEGVLRRQRPLEDEFEREAKRLSTRDRGFARSVVATTLRRLGQIDIVLKGCLDRPLPAKLAPIRDLLRLSAAQLIFLDTPAHAVVDTAVEITKRGKFAPYAGMVNAVLRRLSREGKDRAEAVDAARLNTPKWLWLSWVEAFGEDTARAIGAAHLGEPPLDFSLKPGLDPDEWAHKLGAVRLPTGSLRRPLGGGIEDLPGFAEGAFWVQDAGAALPVKLLGDVNGRHVLDLCAAPGGKTAQLAAAGARVTAVDRSERRLRRLSENLARLSLSAEVIAADAAEWRPEGLADAVLLDAPCSATGTIRRHPDVARLKDPDAVNTLVPLQASILRASADMVAPGGRVIYCVCSLQPEEGPGQIANALAEGLPFVREPVTAADVGGLSELITADGDLRTLPCHAPEIGGFDGFFAARLRRV